eukprot:1314227-Alexandrium_andersonii.AAC.1
MESIGVQTGTPEATGVLGRSIGCRPASGAPARSWGLKLKAQKLSFGRAVRLFGPDFECNNI